MASWGNNDNSANAPYWAVNSTIAPDNPNRATPTSANVALLYGNTTSNVYTTNETIGLFARNRQEIQDAGNIYAHTGWIIETTGIGGRAGRVQTEVLVALADVIGNDVTLADYPVPGSGDYQTAEEAFDGMSYSVAGTPVAATGGVDTVTNSVPGLFRKKYNGHYTALGGLPASWNSTFFSSNTAIKAISDTDVSWGNQLDTAEQENFSMEWKGYIQVPTTQNYNFYASVDDDCAVWIGSTALTAVPAQNTMYGSNEGMPNSGITNANSLTMTAGKWYPIRIWFTEFSGGSKFQLFAIGANGNTYNGSDLTWAHNASTGGY